MVDASGDPILDEPDDTDGRARATVTPREPPPLPPGAPGVPKARRASILPKGWARRLTADGEL